MGDRQCVASTTVDGDDDADVRRVAAGGLSLDPDGAQDDQQPETRWMREDAAEADGDTGAASQQGGSVGDHPELGGWSDRIPTIYSHGLSLALATDECHVEYPWHDPSHGGLPVTFADTLGASGRFQDPLWRVEFDLSGLEQELLRSWPVRRLGFIAHAGAAAMISTQTYSRLEHSLGLLALVVHFSPEDRYSRAAALLHDVGHLPLSHTFEGVAGLDHHQLGIRRVNELAPLLSRHGLDPHLVIETVSGSRPSVLQGDQDGLRLDHLESFVRSGRAHGRTREPPPSTLAKLRVSNGVVDTDTGTAAYLIELIEAEARWQSSEPNVVATGVVRSLAERLIEGRSSTAGQCRPSCHWLMICPGCPGE